MVALRCSIPGCSFSTPENDDQMCNMVLLLAHTNYHLVSLLLPPPPPPSVFSVNLLPPLLPFPPSLRYPVPSAPNTPTVSLTSKIRATASSLSSKRVLSPFHNQRVERYRRQVPTQAELESASNARNRTVSSVSATSTGDLDVETVPGFVISNIRSVEERVESPFIFDTPKMSKNWSETLNIPPKEEYCEISTATCQLKYLNKIVQSKQLQTFDPNNRLLHISWSSIGKLLPNHSYR